jgi:hypothetical protein
MKVASISPTGFTNAGGFGAGSETGAGPSGRPGAFLLGTFLPGLLGHLGALGSPGSLRLPGFGDPGIRGGSIGRTRRSMEEMVSP